MDRIIRALRPHRLGVVLQGIISFIDTLVGISQETIHRAVRDVIRVILEEFGEFADNLWGLVWLCVVEVDEREAVAHVAGVGSIGKLLEVCAAGGERFLIFIT